MTKYKIVHIGNLGLYITGVGACVGSKYEENVFTDFDHFVYAYAFSIESNVRFQDFNSVPHVPVPNFQIFSITLVSMKFS